MSFGGGPSGYRAIKALVESQADLRAVADKDWAAAAGLIVRKLLIAAGQTSESLIALRATVGDEIFETQLKTLTHHQAKLLAKRLDKTVPDFDVSSAAAAIAHVRTLLAPALVVEEKAADPEPEVTTPDPTTDETETVSDASADDTPPSPPDSPNPYFGRKSFRTG